LAGTAHIVTLISMRAVNVIISLLFISQSSFAAKIQLYSESTIPSIEKKIHLHQYCKENSNPRKKPCLRAF